MSKMDFISERHDIQYQPVYTRKSETHIRQADTLSDVVVPGLQALITGALSCMAAAAIAYPLKLSFVIPVGAFAAGFAAMWFWRMREHSKLLRAVETITHHDLDHDGFVGQPPVPEPRRSFNITLTEKAHGGSRTRIIEVPVSDDAFAQFARAALEDRPLTHRAWAGADKPMTDGEYRKLQSILLADGLLEWGTINGKRTVVASEKGKRAMTEFVNEFDARAGDDDEQA